MAFNNQVLLGALQARGGSVGLTGNAENHQNVKAVVVIVNCTAIGAGVYNIQMQTRNTALDNNWTTIAQTPNVNVTGYKVFCFTSTHTGSGSAYTNTIQVDFPDEWRIVLAEDAAAKTYGAAYEIIGPGMSAPSFN